MVALYVDEDCSYPVVQRLRQLGHDMLTAHEAGQAGQGIEDAVVLAFATAAGRAVLTFNWHHFIRLVTLIEGLGVLRNKVAPPEINDPDHRCKAAVTV